MMRRCASPIEDDVFLDWWTGEAADARALEEHLLGCDECAGRLRRVSALAAGVRTLARGGRVQVVVLPAQLSMLQSEGRRVREYRVPAGGGVQCTVGPEDDVVLARLAADLTGVGRLDLVSCVDDGPDQRLSDLPFDPGAPEVILASPTDVLRARPASVERMRLVAVEPAGERLLGEYTFNHSPWPGLG